jgi:hypothetical protein
MLDSWLIYLAKKNILPSTATAKFSTLHIFDEDGNSKTCSVFDCFGYEITVGGST